VAVFLVKGVKLQGVITAFDSFSIQLRRGNGGQLVYKHAISTIAPAQWPEGFMADAEPAQAAEGDLQDQFLLNAQAHKAAMSLFLMNGVMLEGKVACFDQYCVVLERAGQAQLIYKHAISTLQPHGPLDPAEQGVAEETAV
jgi:host factor-I protein